MRGPGSEERVPLAREPGNLQAQGMDPGFERAPEYLPALLVGADLQPQADVEVGVLRDRRPEEIHGHAPPLLQGALDRANSPRLDLLPEAAAAEVGMVLFLLQDTLCHVRPGRVAAA